MCSPINDGEELSSTFINIANGAPTNTLTNFGNLITNFGNLIRNFGNLITNFDNLITNFGNLITNSSLFM